MAARRLAENPDAQMLLVEGGAAMTRMPWQSQACGRQILGVTVIGLACEVIPFIIDGRSRYRWVRSSVVARRSTSWTRPGHTDATGVYSMSNHAKRHRDTMRSSSCAARRLEYCLARELSDFSHGVVDASIRVSLRL